MVIDDDQIVDDEEIIENQEEEIVESSDAPEEESPESIQDEDEEDRIVTIGDAVSEEPSGDEESEDKETPGWVKTLRKVNRKQESEIKRLKKQLEEKDRSVEAEKPVEVGEKPTLASCSYDDKKYEQELVSYYERKKKADEQAAEKAKTAEAQKKVYESRREQYAARRKEHGFKDFTEAEEIVADTLSVLQQDIIIQGADDSALLVYALGKNHKKLEELSKITDPVKFAFEVAKVESQLKVTNRKAPAPEKRVAAGKSGGSSGSSDKVLDRLREEASKTGDYSKVLEYKNKLRKG